MSSWNRRLSAAQQRPTARVAFSKEELLQEAAALHVEPDDQAALLALARIAMERPGYRATILVGTTAGPDSELLFEVFGTDAGPIARTLGELPPADAPATAAPESAPSADPPVDADRRDDGPDILPILTDTVVETPDLVAVFASVGHDALWANDAFVALIPIREGDGVWFVELLDEWSKGHFEVKVLPALVKYGRWRGRLTLLTGNGEPLPVSAVVVAHRDPRGEIEAISMVARDLADLRLAEERVAASETRFAALVEHVSDVIAVLGGDGSVRYASPAVDRILGRAEGSMAGTNLLDLIHPDDRPDDIISLAQADEHGIGEPVELRLQSSDGSWRYLEIVVSDLRSNPAIEGLVLNARDVTERVETVQNLATKAFTDPMTGLPNRMRMLDRLGQALQDDAPASSACLLLLDLDHFKAINDGYGKDVADAVVVQTAARLASVASDDMTVARLRSDEFAVLAPGVTDRDTATELADRLRATVAEPIDVLGRTVTVSATIGVAFNAAGHDPEDLLHDADHALAVAKEAGRDRVEVFTDEMREQVTQRRTIEQRLRQVLDAEQVVLHYQPIVDLQSGQAVGAEALLRVHDGDGILLSPAGFVDAAESSGLMSQLGSQILQVTARQLAAWDADLDDAPGEISINVSLRQLADSELAERVRAALDEAGLDPHRLCIELTESVFLGHQAIVDSSVAELRDLGVRIGIDEFGSGQSSLAYLKRFPLDFVKIDRSLVAGLGHNDQDTAIVRATLDLAHNLDLVVTAVGVESAEQREMLVLLGCDRAQGFFFGAPLPGEEFGHIAV